MNSSIPENKTHEATEPARMAVLDAGTTSTLRDAPLGDSWKIGDQLPKGKEQHAAVYLVLDKSDMPVEGLEAHAFTLGNTQPKIRKHRLRCIKRMTHRTKLEVRIQDTVIIVISASPTICVHYSEQNETIDGRRIAQNGRKSNREAATKMPYEQESARIRQRERRQAKRSRKVEQQPGTADSVQKRTKPTTLDDKHAGYTAFLTLFWVLYTEEGTMKRGVPHEHLKFGKETGSDSLYKSLLQLPVSLYEALEKYLKETIKIEWHLDKKSYLRAKQGERISLQRQLARLPSAQKYHHDKLATLNREQDQYQKSSAEWRQIESGPKMEAALQCQIVAHTEKVLHRILASREAEIKHIKQRWSQNLDELDSERLSEQRKRLASQMARYEEWTQTAFLVSYTRAKLLRQLEEVKIALTAFAYFPSATYNVPRGA